MSVRVQGILALILAPTPQAATYALVLKGIKAMVSKMALVVLLIVRNFLRGSA